MNAPPHRLTASPPHRRTAHHATPRHTTNLTRGDEDEDGDVFLGRSAVDAASTVLINHHHHQHQQHRHRQQHQRQQHDHKHCPPLPTTAAHYHYPLLPTTAHHCPTLPINITAITATTTARCSADACCSALAPRRVPRSCSTRRPQLRPTDGSHRPKRPREGRCQMRLRPRSRCSLLYRQRAYCERVMGEGVGEGCARVG